MKMVINCLIFLWILAILSGCDFISDRLCEKKELLRLVNPDKKVESVLVRISCGGATTSFSYRVGIVVPGKKVERSDTVFLAEKLEDATLKWISPKELEINYKEAKIFRFTNFWRSKEVDNYKYVVNIRETKIRE